MPVGTHENASQRSLAFWPQQKNLRPWLAVCFDTVCITDGLPQSHGGAAMPRRPPHPQSGVQPLPSLLQLHDRVAQQSPSLFGLQPQPSAGEPFASWSRRGRPCGSPFCAGESEN